MIKFEIGKSYPITWHDGSVITETVNARTAVSIFTGHRRERTKIKVCPISGNEIAFVHGSKNPPIKAENIAA